MLHLIFCTFAKLYCDNIDYHDNYSHDIPYNEIFAIAYP